MPEDPAPVTSTIVTKKTRKTDLPPVQEIPKPEPLTEE
jgi:hypothetical protein